MDASHQNSGEAPDRSARPPGEGRRLSWWRRILAIGPPEAFAAARLPVRDGIFSDKPLSPRTVVLVFAALAVLYGLLWTRWWRPLADSALYLSLARNLCEGRGYTFMGPPHCQAPPGYPLFLAGLMKISRTFAWLHVSSITLTWLSLVLAYVALRRWAPQRAALLAAAVAGATYWYYQNATVLMTEPLFLCFFWLFVIALSRCVARGRIRPAWLVMALACYTLAFATRSAAIFLTPGFLAAFWFGTKHVAAVRRRLAVCLLAAAVVAIAAGLYLLRHYLHPDPNLLASARARPAGSRGLASPIYGYWLVPRLHWSLGTALYQIAPRAAKSLIRWLATTLVAGAQVAFVTPSRPARIAAYAVCVLPPAIVLIGIGRLVRSGCGWLFWPLIYMLPLLLCWGAKVRPRYLNPILPQLLLAGFLGLRTVWQWMPAALKRRRLAALPGRHAVAIAAALIVVGNLPPYALDVYFRHLSRGHYYDVVRNGAYGPVVDAAAYVRAHDEPNRPLIIDRPFMFRHIHLMTGKRLLVGNRRIYADPSEKVMERVRKLAPEGSFVLVCLCKRRDWPKWHLGGGRRPPDGYWALYRARADGKLERIHPPVSRDFLLRVPEGSI